MANKWSISIAKRLANSRCTS